MQEFQSTKTFLLKDTLKIDQRFFVTTKIKNTVLWTYVISDWNREAITGASYEKELQKTNQEKFRIERLKEKVINCMSFNSWIDKKDIV